jgi:hypothetical protein
MRRHAVKPLIAFITVALVELFAPKPLAGKTIPAPG